MEMSKYSPVIEETFLDYPSPEGNAVLVYLTGCEHHCPNCHSPILQKIQDYIDTPEELTEKITDYCKRADTNKIVLLGGDPLHPANLELTRYILNKIGKTHDICVFTGYDIDYVKENKLTGAKYWKCGLFIQEQARKSGKTDTEYTLASPNQNFYDENYNQISQNGILNFNNLEKGK